MQPLQQLKYFKLLIPAKGQAFHDRIVEARLNLEINHRKHIVQDRIVFSFLAYRSAIGKGASIREITRETALHGKTVTKSLQHLGDMVNRQGPKWLAVEPPEDCFIAVWDAKHWYNRLAYVKLFLPRSGAKFQQGGKSRRFGLNHSLVYSQLLSLAKDGTIRRFTVRGLCAMLDGISEKTVQSVLHDLQHLRLISEVQSDLQLMPMADDHLALFEPRQMQEVAVPRVDQEQPIARPDLHSYFFKDDGLDDYRRHCVGLMPQSEAEQAISKVRRLGYDDIGFLCEIDRWKKQNDQNVIDGKVGCPNFGRYLNTILQRRVEKLEEQERATLAAADEKDFRSSPEGKQAEAEKRKRIAADPMHSEHIVDVQSITSRVRLADNELKNWQAAQSIIEKVGRHCHRFLSDKTANIDFVVAEAGNLRTVILKTALTALNGYYQQETLATEDQLKTAINEAITGSTNWDMPPLFAEVPDVEVAHA